MTPEQRRLLQESWVPIERRGDELAAVFYAQLFALDPRTRALFADTDMVAQRKKFIQMLGAIVRVLDDLEELVPTAAALGRVHANHGVQDSDYHTVGQALILMFEQGLGEEFNAPVREAWGEGYRLLAAVMQRATASGGRPNVAGAPA